MSSQVKPNVNILDFVSLALLSLVLLHNTYTRISYSTNCVWQKKKFARVEWITFERSEAHWVMLFTNEINSLLIIFINRPNNWCKYNKYSCRVTFFFASSCFISWIYGRFSWALRHTNCTPYICSILNLRYCCCISAADTIGVHSYRKWHLLIVTFVRHFKLMYLLYIRNAKNIRDNTE